MTKMRPKFIPAAPTDLQVCRVTNPLDVRQTFRELTAQTCPSGEEDARFAPLMAEYGFTRDAYGNYYRTVGESSVAFTAHLDDVSMTRQDVKHVEEGGLLGTDGASILGADCKAGVAVMLFMLASGIVPGTYIFFASEEVGRVGSEAAARAGSIPLDGVTKMVSFDRRGYDSVITHQAGQRTASDTFAQALADELDLYGVSAQEWKPDPHGSYTDSLSYAALISECTNLSVGYHNAHQRTEVVDLDFLTRLAEACTLVDWEGLPAVRTPQQEDDFLDADAYSYIGCTQGITAGLLDGTLTGIDLVAYDPYAAADLIDYLQAAYPAAFDEAVKRVMV